MIIKSAFKDDLPAIRNLMRKYGKMVVGLEHLNKRDIALQARLDSGELVGFIWCGLMAKNTVGYIDKFCVDPEYSHKRIGKALSLRLQLELHKRGVRSVFGVIRQDIHHEKSAMNALRLAMGAHEAPYTYVETDVLHSIKELQALGDK